VGGPRPGSAQVSADGQNVNGVTSWSHVRFSNGGPVYCGWISDYHLSNLGSHFWC
jgi:hypothetical protein